MCYWKIFWANFWRQSVVKSTVFEQRLLDNTVSSHPDHTLLTQAEKTIHELALRINSVRESKHEEDLQETLKKLELLLITEVSRAHFLLWSPRHISDTVRSIFVFKEVAQWPKTSGLTNFPGDFWLTEACDKPRLWNMCRLIVRKWCCVMRGLLAASSCCIRDAIAQLTSAVDKL